MNKQKCNSMKYLRSVAALCAALGALWTGEARAGDVYLVPQGPPAPGYDALTSDDPMVYVKRYYDWRIEMLQKQLPMREIAPQQLGAPIDGVQATVEVQRNRVPLGAKVLVKLVLKNVSDKVVSLARKRNLQTECGLTTLVDGPNGRVPYRWQSDLEEGHCQIATTVPDWDTRRWPRQIYPGYTVEIPFDLAVEFDLTVPGRYDVVVKYPLPSVSREKPYFDITTVETFAVSNKVTITVY